MEQSMNGQDNDKTFRDSGTYPNGTDEPVITIELESFGDENEKSQIIENKEEEQITRELDLLYEKSSPKGHIAKKNSSSVITLKTVPSGHLGMKSTPSFKALKSDSHVSVGMNSQDSFSSLKRESVSDFDILAANVDEQTRCDIFLIRTSHIILVVSALVLFFISFLLSRQKITQLVGQSIPQVTAGFGILTFLIFLLGVLANHRAWICGFNMQAVCLIILILAEALVICATIFQKYEIFYESDVYWANLSDKGKVRVMANWQCCGWLNACDISDVSSIYFEYRHYQDFVCFNATESETMGWMTEVAIIFGSFVLFQILYMICIITCQSQRLKRRRKKIVKKGFEKRKAAQRRRKSSFARWRSISISSSFSTSNVKRRLSRVAALPPKLRHRMSVGRNTTNINIMASETDLIRRNDGYAGYSSRPA